MDRVRAHLWISGRVQGVCFRAYTSDEASMLGLDGWVRNMYDGRVEALFEGERDRVEQAIVWCRHGPRHALVTDVELLWESVQDDMHGFTVRY